MAIAMLASCTSRPQTQLSSTASVTVNGNGTDFHVVKCSQVEWIRTIEIGSDFAGAKVVIDQRGEPAAAESVHIQNLGGFSGMYSRGDGGDAKMSMNAEKYTITGTANGYKTDKPSEPATATFKITAAC
nr:lipoprotein LpqH [Mycobacterium sp. 852002-51057_SCH5723018]